MRIGEPLEVMSDEEQARILLEGQNDFSAKICRESSFNSVDLDALKLLKDLYQRKTLKTNKSKHCLMCSF